MRNLSLLSLMLLCALTVHAQSFHDRLEENRQLLTEGKTEQAIAGFRDMQVDHPDSPHLYFGIGSALYREAMKHAAKEAFDEASQSLQQARDAFEEARARGEGTIQSEASFQSANTVAQAAKMAAKQGDRNKTMEAFEEALRAYDEHLETFPGHAGAQHNESHMRYQLKQILQEEPPPPPPQSGEDQQNEDSEEGEEQEQQTQPDEQEQEQQEEQRPEEQEQEENQQEEQQQEQQQQQEQPEEQEQQQEQQGEGEGEQEEQEQEQPPQQQQAQQQPQDMERQELEALLQSLEDRDAREQEELRRVRIVPSRSTEWW